MMGSPFYYDVLFDDGPGDVVFHDCMWSGICTCCIQLLHQDSFYYTNESPDLKVDLFHQQQLNNSDNNSSSSLTKESHHHSNYSHIDQQQDLKVAGHLINHHHQSSNLNNKINTSNNHHNHHLDSALTLSSDSASPVTASSSSTNNINLNNNTSPDKAPSSSTCISPDTASSSNSTSPDTASSLSPKPIRRREHNDSERKRRDHLRNAFNFLRDQVPRFKAINKKPPRIQILHEATLYVQRIMKESQELERRLSDERAKHERLQNL